jgi:vacuolar iron transporter family protein
MRIRAAASGLRAPVCAASADEDEAAALCSGRDYREQLRRRVRTALLLEDRMAAMSWLQHVIEDRGLADWQERARESILDVNDGIVSAAGIAEGFARAGASTRTLVFAGAAVILAGGLAAAGARYTEERIEWEMNRRLLESERASIETDPAGEFEELVQIYEAKGLSSGLARRVAQELTESDPVAAHADAELHLDSTGSAHTSVYAAGIAGLFYGIGAAIPLAAMRWLPVGQRIELTFATVLVALALTGWFASWLTGLPVLRLVRRNLVLGAATMAAGLLVGLVVAI